MLTSETRPDQFARESDVGAIDPGTDTIRIFISYSRDDRDTVAKVADILRARGLRVIYDEHLLYGSGVHGQIKHLIEHAHIFMPLLTSSAYQRQWVQQEIGYAVALRVPVVPIAIDYDPDAFLYGIQAIKLGGRTSRSCQPRSKRIPWSAAWPVRRP